MKAVTKTALANIKQNKERNILCGFAIALTTLLIFIVLTVGYGLIRVEFAAVNVYYPTYHLMFRDVSDKNVQALQVHHDIEELGTRIDFGVVSDDDATILMTALDQEGIRMNRLKLQKGSFPKEKQDIVVSQEVLNELGIQAEIGDAIKIPYQMFEKAGMSYEKEDTFHISGFFEESDTNKENKIYSVMISMDYVEEAIPEAERNYRVMFRVSGSDYMTVDTIIEKGKEIGSYFGVSESNIVENREYLSANYVDPAFVQGIIIIILLVVVAGILTIYSIYYVSMIPKVQEYGKLKAIGATKKQIRQIVFREGMLVTLAALPVGLLFSSFLSVWIIKGMVSFIAKDNPLIQIAEELLQKGEVPLLYWWIYLITIVVVFFTSTVSLAKPMRIASRISPVEAMRYHVDSNGERAIRKGYENLTLFRLTKANMMRHKKRTVLTIITLGAIGVLFMIVATILTCAAPKEIVKKEMESDYQIKLEVWDGDKMHPERAWRNVQQNNPLTEDFIQKIQNVAGVEEVKIKTFIDGVSPQLVKDGEAWGADIIGLDPSYAELLEKGEKQGHITYEELKQGKKIIMSDDMLYWFPDLKVGDSLHMSLNVGNEQIEKNFEIGAIGSYDSSLSRSSFYLPQSVLEELNPNNLNYTLEITVDPAKKNTAYQELQTLADTSEYLIAESYEEHLHQWEVQMRLMSALCYTFMLILGGIGIMNLINTLVNSIYTRRRELGMIQAIGMSEKQLIHMLQQEGIIYTFGTLLISIGIGSLLGYGAFLYAKDTHMLQISVYHYPLIPALLLTGVVILLQLILTYRVSANFRKLSLIERIRYTE